MKEIDVQIQRDGVIVTTRRFSESLSLGFALVIGAITLVLSAGLTFGVTAVASQLGQGELSPKLETFVLWCGSVASAIVTVVMAGFAYSRCRHRKIRLADGMCVACGYDLKGNASGRCPECGVEAFPYEEARHILVEQGVRLWMYEPEEVVTGSE